MHFAHILLHVSPWTHHIAFTPVQYSKQVRGKNHEINKEGHQGVVIVVDVPWSGSRCTAVARGFVEAFLFQM